MPTYRVSPPASSDAGGETCFIVIRHQQNQNFATEWAKLMVFLVPADVALQGSIPAIRRFLKKRS